jgi:hypothetical protein
MIYRLQGSVAIGCFIQEVKDFDVLNHTGTWPRTPKGFPRAICVTVALHIGEDSGCFFARCFCARIAASINVKAAGSCGRVGCW